MEPTDRDYEHCGGRSCMEACGCACSECREAVKAMYEIASPHGVNHIPMTIREACRNRVALGGVDAEALEHGMVQLESELKAALLQKDALQRSLDQLQKEHFDAVKELTEQERLYSELKEEVLNAIPYLKCAQLHNPTDAKRDMIRQLEEMTNPLKRKCEDCSGPAGTLKCAGGSGCYCGCHSEKRSVPVTLDSRARCGKSVGTANVTCDMKPGHTGECAFYMAT